MAIDSADNIHFDLFKHIAAFSLGEVCDLELPAVVSQQYSVFLEVFGKSAENFFQQLLECPANELNGTTFSSSCARNLILWWTRS